MKSIRLLLLLASGVTTGAFAQSGGLTDMSQSRFAKMANTELGAVHWTDGFWGDRFNVYSHTSLQSMWDTWNNPDVSHGFRNFEIAAGVCEGEHWGPPFHDGDMYKWMEGVASVYAVTKDPELDKLMDHFIEHVVKAQRADGYIHTPVIIEEKNKGIDTHSEKQQQTVIGTKVGGEDEKGAFANRLNFETYNLGHLMMAGIIHRRATGKTTLFDAAVKATDFLCHFYETASAELARNAICPSHYMGVVEMYRATGNPRYLELSKNLIDIRGMVENGTDDNQDRIPFRQQYNAMGHAVRSNYLYAGVTDVYAETGEDQLMKNLTSIWKDIVTRKMYVTGACGALYDGTSPDGTCYEPDSIQKVHQSYGRPYQLPNSTAHNETCANIGNMLFNWRMLEVTGDAKYAAFVLGEEYENLSWYGRGPWENYPDRKTSCLIGRWSSKVSSQYTHYPRPQDSGNHEDVTEVTLTNKEGKGIRVTAIDRPFSFSALYYTVDDIYKATHDCDLKPRKEIILSLDAAVLGLGNSSCGPGVLKKYAIDKQKPHTLRVRFSLIK